MKILVDAEKCTGCRICELVCSQSKLQDFNPKMACIKVINLDYWGFSNPVLCIQCKKPACVEACPTDALTQLENGVIRLDKTKCDACGLCVDACPIGAINWDNVQAKPMICDQCGGSPLCVEWCPSGVLTTNSSPAERKRPRGRKELKVSIAKGKRSLAKLNIPKEVFAWYDKFVQ